MTTNPAVMADRAALREAAEAIVEWADDRTPRTRPQAFSSLLGRIDDLRRALATTPAPEATPQAPTADVLREALYAEIGRRLTDARIEEILRAESIPLHGRELGLDLRSRYAAVMVRRTAMEAIDAAIDARLATQPEPHVHEYDYHDSRCVVSGLYPPSCERCLSCEAVDTCKCGFQRRLAAQPEPAPEGLDVDLRTIRRSLPQIVGPGTAGLWMAFGRIEKALTLGVYREATQPEPAPEGLDVERLARALDSVPFDSEMTQRELAAFVAAAYREATR